MITPPCVIKYIADSACMDRVVSNIPFVCMFVENLLPDQDVAHIAQPTLSAALSELGSVERLALGGAGEGFVRIGASSGWRSIESGHRGPSAGSAITLMYPW